MSEFDFDSIPGPSYDDVSAAYGDAYDFSAEDQASGGAFEEIADIFPEFPNELEDAVSRQVEERLGPFTGFVEQVEHETAADQVAESVAGVLIDEMGLSGEDAVRAFDAAEALYPYVVAQHGASRETAELTLRYAAGLAPTMEVYERLTNGKATYDDVISAWSQDGPAPRYKPTGETYNDVINRWASYGR
jgi:hypothetical protein